MLPGSPAATRVIAGLETLEEVGSFFFLQIFDLAGDGDDCGDGWGASVGKGEGLAGKGEPEEEGDGGEDVSATRVATGGPGKM